MTQTYIPLDFTADFFQPRPGTSIAYQATAGNAPGVFWCGGYRSDMTGSKASYLAEQCAARGYAFTRFDYTGHGQSSGTLAEGSIGKWLTDALDVFDTLTTGPQIIVGSSMGGWISLLMAEQRQSRVAGLVTIAAAPDFSAERYQTLSEDQKTLLKNGGAIDWPSDFGEPHPLRQDFFDDGQKHLMLHRSIDYKGPVRLLHGKADDVVPWQKSESIKEKLLSNDVEITWIDDGDHRLSRDEDLKVLDRLVSSLQRPGGI